MRFGYRDRETERQRDRETERQRDRETERQRDRETERQRDREKERQKYVRKTENSFLPETAVGHYYGVIDVYPEVHEDRAKEMGAAIVGEKKNYEIFKVRLGQVR